MFDLKKWIAKVTQYIVDAKSPEEFGLTRNSSISGGQGSGIYDKVSGIVRISFVFNNGDTAIPVSTNLFTIPSKYRPSENKHGQGMAWTGGGSTKIAVGSNVSARSDGGIRQNASNNTTRGFGYIEYLL